MAEDGAQDGRALVTDANGRIVRAWLWVVICIAIIWTLSSEGFSARSTSRFLTPFLQWIYPEISAHALHTVHVMVRKSAHFTEYSVLALLSFRALRISLDLSVLRLGLITLALVLTVSGIDEARQLLVPSRTGSVMDVALDFTGGAVAVLLVVAFHRWLGIGAPLQRPREGA